MPLLTALIAIVLAIGSSAFTTVKKQKNTNELYFVLKNQSDESSYAARVMPGNWELANNDGSNISCITGTSHLCKIRAEESSGEPVIGGPSDPLYDKLYNSGSNSIPTQDDATVFTRGEDD